MVLQKPAALGGTTALIRLAGGKPRPLSPQSLFPSSVAGLHSPRQVFTHQVFKVIQPSGMCRQ